MSYTKRQYRTNLAMQGIVFLDGMEIDCTVLDLSITGARIKVEPGKAFSDTQVFAQTIDIHAMVDIRIAELRMDGEVQVVRKDVEEGNLYISVEFKNIFYGLENIPYARKSYRKGRRSYGQLLYQDKTYEVVSENLSNKGMQLICYQRLEFEPDSIVQVNFHHLSVHGTAKVVWFLSGNRDYTQLGIEFIQLNNSVKGVPAFNQEQ